jgi:hypothetical protein
MNLRGIPLFDAEGRGTRFLESQWFKQGGEQAFLFSAPLVDAKGRPTAYLLKLWPVAFPTKPALPPIVGVGGFGSDGFWDVFD